MKRVLRIETLLALLAAFALPAGAASKYNLCFPSTTWFGAAAPTIDGNIDGDPGWRGAFQYRFDNGTSNPDVVVQGIRDGTNSNIYISVKVSNLMDLDQFSGVALAFDPSNGADLTKQQLVVIFPVIAAAATGTTSPPKEIDYYRGSPWGASVPWSPAATVITAYNSAGASYQWSMEAQLKIDPTGINGLALPASGFGLYISVLTVPNEKPTDAQGSGLAVDYDWPPDAPTLGCSNAPTCEIPQSIPVNQSPGSLNWGAGSINPASVCQGVTVTSQTGNIYVNSPGNLTINRDSNPNTFFAYLQNTMVNNTGTPVAAQGITATFKIANFGLPDTWTIPGTLRGNLIGGDPTNPSVSIPKSGAATLCSGAANNNNSNCILQTGTWILNSQEQTDYNTPATQHQCILVELASDPGSNTVFVNNSAVQNMNFPAPTAMARFHGIAEISARSFANEQVFELHVNTAQQVLKPQREAAASGNQILSQLTWEAHGYRQTDGFLNIHGKKIRLGRSAGAFGYVIRQSGDKPVDQWNQELTGVEHIDNNPNLYRVRVPGKGVRQVNTVAAPQGISLQAGGRGCFDKGSQPAFFLLLGGIVLIGFAANRSRGEK
ncbi:MAG TPA: hypothetical protein VGL72_07630 [Bryobacteraceae bacterium]